jgi:site-specific DNA recombinase
MKKTKVYIYTRVSTSMQIDGYSLDAQKERLTKYAEGNDMVIAGEYSDEGKSGKNIAGRVDFQRMLNDIACKKDGVEYVLVFKLSRFGRNAADTLTSLQFMQDYGVNLISVEDGIDSSKEAGKLMVHVLSAVAEIERENILVQTMEGRKQKAREGKWNGGFAPYGYKLVDGELIIEEDEAEAIRIIFDKFVHTNLGYNGVVNYLNNNGIKKKARQNGYLTQFTTSTVKAILDNPVYYGKIAYGRRKTTKIEGTRNEYHVVAQKEFDLYDGRHKAIVDEQLWKDAQAKRRATASKLEKKHDLDHEHVLSGLVKCPVCGAGLYGNVKRAKRKDGTYYKTYFSYACKHRLNKDGHKCDYHRQWSEEKVDNAVSEIIRKLVNNPRFSEVMKTKINTSVDTSEAEKELANAKKVLKQLIGTKDKIILQIDTLDILDKNYDRKYDDLQKRLDTIYDKIGDAEDLVSETEDKLSNIQKDKITGDNIYNYLLMFDSVYDVLSDMEKKQFYNALLTDIQIYEEEQDKQIIKSIGFKFPVFYDGEFTKRIIRDKEKTVESIVLLSHKSPDSHIDVKVEFGEGEEKVPLDKIAERAKQYQPAPRVTYKMIQEYIEEKYGFKVHTAYIAEVKRNLGFPMYDAPNMVEELKQPRRHPTAEKVEAIKDALKHFGVI